MNIENILSKRDMALLLDLIQKSLLCRSESEFRDLLNSLKKIINYEYALCALADLDDKTGFIKSYETINISYPSEWMELYLEKRFDQIDPIVIENITKYDLQYWNETYRKSNPPKEFLYLSQDFGLKEGYSYGLCDFIKTKGSLFSFSGRSVHQHIRTQTILKYIIPHFHQALIRVVSQDKNKEFINTKHIISLREKEILKWLKSGKSSWEISNILHIGECTVNFHIRNILRKLNAVKRGQAVAIAIENGLIGIQ
ncbi:MAG: autoinducer binding domain-containing protein [bacterium]